HAAQRKAEAGWTEGTALQPGEGPRGEGEPLSEGAGCRQAPERVAGEDQEERPQCPAIGRINLSVGTRPPLVPKQSLGTRNSASGYGLDGFEIPQLSQNALVQ